MNHSGPPDWHATFYGCGIGNWERMCGLPVTDGTTYAPQEPGFMPIHIKYRQAVLKAWDKIRADEAPHVRSKYLKFCADHPEFVKQYLEQ